MITTYWRIPNIFTISQEHKGKTTGNGANFPTLHSNKPEQRSEKIYAGTRRGCSLEPQKVTREAPVKARHVYPRAGRGQERRGERRSGISQLHFAAKTSSGLSGEEGGGRSWQYSALGGFPSPACLLPASSPANFVVGLVNAAWGSAASSWQSWAAGWLISLSANCAGAAPRFVGALRG